MRFFFSLFFAQLKRARYALPKGIIGAMLLSLIGGGIAFSGSALLYKEDAPLTASVAVAGADGNGEQLLLSFVGSMDSLRSFPLVSMTREEAYEAVRTGSACAALLLPDGLLDGILTGEARSITLLLSGNDPLSSLLLKELAASGADMLCSAQAGIYAVHDLYLRENLAAELSSAYEDINRINLSYALRREALFHVSSVSASGTLSVRDYYIWAALFFILLFLGVLFGSFLTPEDSSFSLLLAAKPHGAFLSVCSRFLSAWAIYLLFFVLLLLPFATDTQFLQTPFLLSLDSVLLLLLIAACLAAYALFCYSCTKTTSGGIFLFSFLGLFMLLLSGAILPLAFLPDTLKTIGSLLPGAVCFHALLAAASGTDWLSNSLPLLFYTVFFFLLSFLALSFDIHPNRRTAAPKSRRKARLSLSFPHIFHIPELFFNRFGTFFCRLRFFLLLEKRLLKKKGMLLLLLAFPALLLLYEKTATQTTDSSVSVALYMEEDTPFTRSLQTELTSTSSLYRFYTVSSKEALLDAVKTKQAECGFLFKAGLISELDAMHLRGQIERFDSPSTTLGSLINEAVYAALFKQYSLHRLQTYLRTESALSASYTDALEAELTERYAFYLTDGVTFSFEPLVLSAKADVETDEETEQAAIPLSHRIFRGLLALYLLLVSLFSVFSFRRDKENGSYAALFSGSRRRVEFLSFFSYLLPAMLFALLTVAFTGSSIGLWKEVFRLLFYGLFLFCYCKLLSLLLKSDAAFAGAVPLLLLGCLVFTPVFIDLSVYVPLLSVLQKLFPTYYYLSFY